MIFLQLIFIKKKAKELSSSFKTYRMNAIMIVSYLRCGEMIFCCFKVKVLNKRVIIKLHKYNKIKSAKIMQMIFYMQY